MAVKKFKNDPSINAITKRMKNLHKFTFSFNFISHDDTVKERNKLKKQEGFTKDRYSYNSCQGKCRYDIQFSVS